MNLFHLKEKKIFEAIKKGDVNNLETLLEDKDININYQNKAKTTFLIEAVRSSNVKIAKLLLEHHADLEIQDFFNCTPLMLAVMEENYELAELFINSGANVNAEDSFGETSLMLALEESFYDIAKLLLDNHADVNAKDKADGYTPLMIEMLLSETFELAPRLIQSGANVNEKDNDNSALIHLLAQEGDIKKIEFLLSYGAKITDIDVEKIEDDEIKDEIQKFLNQKGMTTQFRIF